MNTFSICCIGATATPLHMAELVREKDATRFDTEKLQKISIDGLTCAQVEEYFTEAIKEGKTKDDEDDEVEQTPSVKKKKDKGKKDETPKEEPTKVISLAKQGSKAEKIDGNGINAKDTDVGKDESGGESTEKQACNDRAAWRKIQLFSNHGMPTQDEDLDPKFALERNANYYWRSATMFGVVLGAGCLFMISRASKLKSGR